MRTHLNLFQNHTQYDSFVGDGIEYPNVSRCNTETHVHYKPSPETRVIVTYYVDSTEYDTKLYYCFTYEGFESEWVRGIDNFDKIEIDGVEVPISTLDANSGFYQFSTTGEHVVAYTLKDPTTIKKSSFKDSSFSIVEIPNGVTTIEEAAFVTCNFISVTIPSSVTTIADYAFCSNQIDNAALTAVTNINPSGATYCRCMD